MKRQDGKPRLFSFTLRDFLIFAAIFICALVLCTLLRRSDISDGFASPVFVLAVLLTSRFTNGYLFGTLAAFLSVIGINYIFTFPYWEFNFTMTGYPLTFFVMLCVSLITCTMTTKIKQQEQFRMESEREKMRANLLRSVSHDIRTPLTSIIGSTSAILETPDLSLDQQHQLLEDVRDDAQWLVRVVENLLSITRMGEDTRITKQPEAAEEVLGEVARKFRKHYPDVKISVAVPDELLIVPMDAILIEQVMTNLLENAVRHGKNTTHIALSVHQEGENAVFAVQDNGGGIPPKLLPVLFESVKMTIFDVDTRQELLSSVLQDVRSGKDNNLFVVSTILVTGIGGLSLTFGKITITPVAVALILGILANQILKGRSANRD